MSPRFHQKSFGRPRCGHILRSRSLTARRSNHVSFATIQEVHNRSRLHTLHGIPAWPITRNPKYTKLMCVLCSAAIYIPQEDSEIDMNASVEGSRRKLIDAAGAGSSLTSPGWLTELGRLYGGKSVSSVI